MTGMTKPTFSQRVTGSVRAFFDGDVWYSFTRSKVTMIAAFVTAVMIMSAVCAPLIAPHNPFDLASIDLMDSQTPPVWMEGGSPDFLLGTDDLGRDVFSTILYGSRISLLVGFASVVFSLVLGVSLGLLSGYVGGVVDAFIMRVAEIQLSGDPDRAAGRRYCPWSAAQRSA